MNEMEIFPELNGKFSLTQIKNFLLPKYKISHTKMKSSPELSENFLLPKCQIFPELNETFP